MERNDSPSKRDSHRKIKKVEAAVVYHKEKTLKDKYFPEQKSFCYDNIGSWFAVHKEDDLVITCICYIGDKMTLWYDSKEGYYFWN